MFHWRATVILRRLRSLASSVRFLIVNLRSFTGLPRFSERTLAGGMLIRACNPCEVREVLALRSQLDGLSLSWTIRMLLKAIPEKCCVVITDERGNLNAVSLFYFNERDILEATVHEGFVGVRGECSGMGLATSIRRLAADHFAQTGTIRGISSRITLSNLASVSSGGKVGYELLETYKDETTGDERGYFINRFRREPQA